MIAHRAPLPLSDALPRPWIFLAGTIDGPAGWRAGISTSVCERIGTLLDPWRPDWDATWHHDLADERFRIQVGWESEAQDRADWILCWFGADGSAPITLLELGLHADSGRVLVGCSRAYPLRGYIQAICRRHRIPLAEALHDLRIPCGGGGG